MAAFLGGGEGRRWRSTGESRSLEERSGDCVLLWPLSLCFSSQLTGHHAMIRPALSCLPHHDGGLPPRLSQHRFLSLSPAFVRPLTVPQM